MITLRPMTGDEAEAFITSQTESYVAERIASGERPEDAQRIADQQAQALFTDGAPAVGQYFYVADDKEGVRVGTLWLGPHPSGQPYALWIFDVEVEARRRGTGLGRAVMLLAEQEARTLGATELGLQVFGHNAVARGLYESLGYETTSATMRKSLPATS